MGRQMLGDWLRKLIGQLLLSAEPPRTGTKRSDNAVPGSPGIGDRLRVLINTPIPPTASVSTKPRARKSRPFDEERRDWHLWLGRIMAGESTGLVVPESLCLAKLRICAIPENLTVEGSLDLRQCQRLRRIGAGLTVQGDLQIGGRCSTTFWYEVESLPVPLCGEGQPPLRELPERMRVDGDLIVRSCHAVQHLPDDIQLGRGLHIEDCHGLESLASQLRIPGNLTLKGCPRLMPCLENCQIDGDVRLIGLPWERLPDSLEIKGSLILENLPRVTQLPQRLKVGQNLIVRHCQIAELPEYVAVGRDLIVRHCPKFRTLPRYMDVQRNVRVAHCPQFTTVPAGMPVRQSLKLWRCPRLVMLPDGLSVPGTLDLTGSGLVSLPHGLRVGFGSSTDYSRATLILTDCVHLTSVPADLDCGPIDIAGSGVRGFPAELVAVRVMWRGRPVISDVVFCPEKVSPMAILDERNAEVRRIMLDRLGCDVVLAKAHATVVHEDTDAGGPRRLVEVPPVAQSNVRRVPPRRYLQCRCPSTGRVYLLRVPPAVADCHAAAAWIAGFDKPEDYRPIQET